MRRLRVARVRRSRVVLGDGSCQRRTRRYGSIIARWCLGCGRGSNGQDHRIGLPRVRAMRGWRCRLPLTMLRGSPGLYRFSHHVQNERTLRFVRGSSEYRHSRRLIRTFFGRVGEMQCGLRKATSCGTRQLIKNAGQWKHLQRTVTANTGQTLRNE